MTLTIHYRDQVLPVIAKFIDEVELNTGGWLILKRAGKECGRYRLEGIQGWRLDEEEDHA